LGVFLNMTRRLPVLTATTLALTASVTATRLYGDGVLHALRRDPSGLEHGQIWRLLSPVLVQSDPAVRDVIGVFALCAVIGAIGERVRREHPRRAVPRGARDRLALAAARPTRRGQRRASAR
jgi:hypothetical protein